MNATVFEGQCKGIIGIFDHLPVEIERTFGLSACVYFHIGLVRIADVMFKRFGD